MLQYSRTRRDPIDPRPAFVKRMNVAPSGRAPCSEKDTREPHILFQIPRMRENHPGASFHGISRQFDIHFSPAVNHLSKSFHKIYVSSEIYYHTMRLKLWKTVMCTYCQILPLVNVKLFVIENNANIVAFTRGERERIGGHLELRVRTWGRP